jgi:hypothetical protein
MKTAFDEIGIDIVKIDGVLMKIYLAVPTNVDVTRVKRVVQFTLGEDMRVFVKEKGERI